MHEQPKATYSSQTGKQEESTTGGKILQGEGTTGRGYYRERVLNATRIDVTQSLRPTKRSWINMSICFLGWPKDMIQVQMLLGRTESRARQVTFKLRMGKWLEGRAY